jgi:uncharacterized lipoprotein YmbA
MSVARIWVASLFALCLLSGCKSTSVHLYTLIPAPAGTPSQVAARPAQGQFVIESVRIPSAIDRKELVVRKSDLELILLENDNWASPLREEVRLGLTTDLKLALAGQSNAAPVGSAPLTLIWIRIPDWEVTAHTVYLKAEWKLRRVDSAAPFDIQCESEFWERTSGTVDDLVRADQALLKDLAQPIARALRTAPAGCVE